MIHFSRVRFRAYQIDESFDFDDTPPPPPPPTALFYDPFGVGATIIPPWSDNSSVAGSAFPVEGSNIFHRVGGDLLAQGAYVLDGDYTQLVAETLYRLSVDVTIPQSALDENAGGFWPGDVLTLVDNWLTDDDPSIGWDIYPNGSGGVYFGDWWNSYTLLDPVVGDTKYHLSVEFTFHSDLTGDSEYFVDGVSIQTTTDDFSGQLVSLPTGIESYINTSNSNFQIILDNVLLESL